MGVDYSEIGLMVGLECHQQLATRCKLFCGCKPQLFKGEPKVTFLRRLRPTQSELGQVDPAAYFEFQKGVRILYEADGETSCLVEMDEEPPHELNREALETTLIVALMMKAKPVDEIHVMRKTVIDGSNTTGFQRTCVVALNGEIDVDGKTVPIQHISLEEDAARKIGEDGYTVRYRIDRLGIPLIEVTTGPVIHSPKEAEAVALAIGRILRATGRVKRGLGTIRQDLNISIRDGALIEIKGVQELELISKVVEYEVQRQLGLLKVRDELRRRGVVEEDLKEEFMDVTEVFEQTGCRVLRRAIKDGKRIFAVKLRGFSGLLSMEIAPGMRLGREMADRARFWGRVKGIFHTDELPAYGITRGEVEKLKRLMGASPDDAVVLVADTIENSTDALRAVVERAREALRGVPEETRAANPDGTTRYMRPRPGAARMYPETDVPPVPITDDYLRELSSRLPKLPDEVVKHLTECYGINVKLAEQLLDSEYLNLFERIAGRVKVSPTVIAATLTETVKALKREGVEVNKVTDEQLMRLFEMVDSGKTAKESIPEVITWLSKHEGEDVESAIRSLGLTMLSRDEIEAVIDDVVEENRDFVMERGMGAFGRLMGIVMKKVRGRAEAKVVSEIIRERISRVKGEDAAM